MILLTKKRKEKKKKSPGQNRGAKAADAKQTRGADSPECCVLQSLINNAPSFILNLPFFFVAPSVPLFFTARLEGELAHGNQIRDNHSTLKRVPKMYGQEVPFILENPAQFINHTKA